MGLKLYAGLTKNRSVVIRKINKKEIVRIDLNLR